MFGPHLHQVNQQQQQPLRLLLRVLDGAHLKSHRMMTLVVGAAQRRLPLLQPRTQTQQRRLNLLVGSGAEVMIYFPTFGSKSNHMKIMEME